MHRERNRRSVAGVAAIALLTLTAGCAASPRHSSGPTGPPPQPQSLQADAVASEEFGLLAGGGWAEAWSLWSSNAQLAITQADFVRLNTDCRPAVGVAWVIDRSSKSDQDTVQVDWHRGSVSGSNTLLFQDGRWRFVPTPAALAEYRRGVGLLVRQRKAAGLCR